VTLTTKDKLALLHYWNSPWVDAHRRGISDIDWAKAQPKGPPKYAEGDVVEFHVGGFGVISEVSEPHNGWPSSYATHDVEGFPPHTNHISAWHYEGDFKRLAAKMHKTFEWL